MLPALGPALVTGASSLIGGLFGQMAAAEQKRREMEAMAAQKAMEAKMAAAQGQYNMQSSGLESLINNYRAALAR